MVAAGLMAFTLLALAAQVHAPFSRVTDKAVLGTKIISKVCECFRYFVCLFCGVFLVAKLQYCKHQSDMVRNSFPYQ